MPALYKQRMESKVTDKITELYAGLLHFEDGVLVRNPKQLTVREALAAEHRSDKKQEMTETCKSVLKQYLDHLRQFSDDPEQVCLVFVSC